MITLNKDQKIAADKIVDFIEGKLDLPFFTLAGAGGTGKTVLLRQALLQTSKFMFDRSAAAVAHAAKNVLSDSFEESIPCYTVAQWLGMKMTYSKSGEIEFKSNNKIIPKLKNFKIAILDEASMINDYLFDAIMKIVTEEKIKLIVVGDIFQLPPVNQEHDSKFFDKIDAHLKQSMRFTGPIVNLSNIYREAIKDINEGFAGDSNILNKKTNRIDSFNKDLNSGYYFKNNIHSLIKQVGEEIKNNNGNINYSRMLAYKNNTVKLLNTEVRKHIYGDYPRQFELGEILISDGGFFSNNSSIITNGQILRVDGIKGIEGPEGLECWSLKFKDFNPNGDVLIPVLSNSVTAVTKYNNIKNKLKENAIRDPGQWFRYYEFLGKFANFDYAYSLSVYKSQGQTLENAYIMEGEIMGIRPLNLKQKFQALYVAVTRASKNVYIYNKNY